MKKYKYWLDSLPFIGGRTVEKLLEHFNDARSVYEACLLNDDDLKNILSKRLDKDKVTQVIKTGADADIDEDYDLMLAKGIRFIDEDDPYYPKRLKAVNNHPYAIYVKGDLPGEDEPAVSVIGSRNCSEYGRIVADAFGSHLGQSRINVISGMAVGVDGLSQQGAIDGGGKTFAVLGSGVDICYPLQNRSLYEAIPQNGGIISAFPPGTPPSRSNFPFRNSIVAALCDVLLVIEARARSGTSITVNLALSMNKDIYAVPGRITDRLSDGCNMLIHQGSGVALSPEDFVSEVNILWARRGETGDVTINRPKEQILCSRAGSLAKANNAPLTGIAGYVDINPMSAEEIHERRLRDEPGAVLSDTLSRLSLMCVRGELIQVASGYYLRPVKK